MGATPKTLDRCTRRHARIFAVKTWRCWCVSPAGIYCCVDKMNRRICLGTVIDYRNWHLGLGRRFRSLKFWFVLRSRGVTGFQKYITDVCQLEVLMVDFNVTCPDICSYLTSALNSTPHSQSAYENLINSAWSRNRSWH